MNSVKQFLLRPWLYVIIVLIGLVFKFYHIDYKYFWRDEVATIEHTSGYQILKFPVNDIKNITYYKDQLHLKTQELTLKSQLMDLSSKVNLNPLHYAVLMFWYRIVGDDIISYRLFSLFFFILTLPILFLLARKLFKSKLAGWIAISFFLFSPFVHIYVHEARYHTFLIFLIVLLHYLFLLAITNKKLKWWITYTLIGILALYASPLTGLMVIGHFIYILFFEKKLLLTHSITSFIMLLSYLPWIIILISNSGEIASSLSWHNYFGFTYNPLKLLLYQLVGFSQYFGHFEGTIPHARYLIFYEFTRSNFYMIFIDIVISILILSSIIYTLIKAPRKISSFISFIVLPFILFFLISDLFRETIGSIMWRYQLTNYIAVSMFVIYFIHQKIKMGKLLYVGIYLGIIVIGMVSSLRIANDRCWEREPYCKERIAEAKLFSKANDLLIITDYSSGTGFGVKSFTAILNECSSKNIDIFRVVPDIQNVESFIADNNYSEIYITHSSSDLIKNLKQQFGEKMDSLEVEGITPTWQINQY